MDAWEVDLRASSPTARRHAEHWRLRVEIAGGIRERELKLTRAQDDAGFDLPGCVKVRIPDPHADDPTVSPWGAVLSLRRAADGPVFVVLAFGLCHPPVDSPCPSVYQRTHRRLTPQQ